MSARRYEFSGDFYKIVGGYFYLVKADGRWFFIPSANQPTENAWGAESSLPLVHRIFDRIGEQGREPVRVTEPEKLRRAIRENGNTAETWISAFPPIDPARV